jgi:hypothetical protein
MSNAPLPTTNQVRSIDTPRRMPIDDAAGFEWNRPKISQALKSDLRKLTPALAQGVRDVVRRKT